MINWSEEICAECPLRDQAGSRVEPIGPTNTDLVIVGMNPGAEELKTGQPFVGRAGQLLTGALAELGIKRENVYITNAVKCGTINNAEPHVDVLRRCADHYLLNELETIKSNSDLDESVRRVRVDGKATTDDLPSNKPKLIIALGKVAVKALLPELGNFRLDTYVGSIVESKYGPILITSHPARILHTNSQFLLKQFKDCLRKAKLYLDDNLQRSDLPEDDVKGIEPEGLDDLANKLLEHPDEPYTLDVEATGLNPWKDRTLTLAITSSMSKDVYVIKLWKCTDEQIKAFLERVKDLKWIAHNTEFDMKFLYYKYEVMLNLYWDTMQAQHVLDEESELGLGSLSIKLLNAPPYKGEAPEVWKMEEEALNAFLNDPEQVKLLIHYNARDVFYTNLIYKYQVKQFEKDPNSLKFYNTFTVPLLKAAIQVSARGLTVSTTEVANIQKELEDEIATLQKTLYGIVGYDFNMRSLDQLTDALVRAGLKTDAMSKTATGKLSLTQDTLGTLTDLQNNVGEIARNVLAIRKNEKLLGTYVKQLSAYMHENKFTKAPAVAIGVKLHASKTYRINSENPNVHNVPRDSAIKKMFVSRPGYRFIGSDYESAEAFHAAKMSGEKKIIDFVLDPTKDQHKYTASYIFNKPEDQISKAERTIAKMSWFLMQYGGTEHGLAYELKIDIKEAIKIVKGIKATFPRLFGFFDTVKETARANGKLTNRFGATRRFKGYDLKVGGAYERQAMNFPMQSEVSIFCHLAYIDLHLISEIVGWHKFRLLFSIHDAIYGEVRDDLIPLVAAVFKKVMEYPREGMYLLTSPEVGSSWYHLGKNLPMTEEEKKQYEEYLTMDIPTLVQLLKDKE